MSLQFRDKDVVRHSVKYFAQVQVDDITPKHFRMPCSLALNFPRILMADMNVVTIAFLCFRLLF